MSQLIFEILYILLLQNAMAGHSRDTITAFFNLPTLFRATLTVMIESDKGIAPHRYYSVTT